MRSLKSAAAASPDQIRSHRFAVAAGALELLVPEAEAIIAVAVIIAQELVMEPVEVLAKELAEALVMAATRLELVAVQIPKLEVLVVEVVISSTLADRDHK